MSVAFRWQHLLRGSLVARLMEIISWARCVLFYVDGKRASGSKIDLRQIMALVTDDLSGCREKLGVSYGMRLSNPSDMDLSIVLKRVFFSFLSV